MWADGCGLLPPLQLALNGSELAAVSVGRASEQKREAVRPPRRNRGKVLLVDSLLILQDFKRGLLRSCSEPLAEIGRAGMCLT